MFNWTLFFVVLALSVLGLWLCQKYLKKEGLYLFCIVATLIAGFYSDVLVGVFGLPIFSRLAIITVVYFALLLSFEKYGKNEAKKIFFASLFSLIAFFVVEFFLIVYANAMSWNIISGSIVSIVAFFAGYLMIELKDKVEFEEMKDFLKCGIMLSVPFILDTFVSTIFLTAGRFSFLTILLAIVVEIIFVVGIAFLLSVLKNKWFVEKEETNEKSENKDVENADGNSIENNQETEPSSEDKTQNLTGDIDSNE